MNNKNHLLEIIGQLTKAFVNNRLAHEAQIQKNHRRSIVAIVIISTISLLSLFASSFNVKGFIQSEQPEIAVLLDLLEKESSRENGKVTKSDYQLVQKLLLIEKTQLEYEIRCNENICLQYIHAKDLHVKIVSDSTNEVILYISAQPL